MPRIPLNVPEKVLVEKRIPSTLNLAQWHLAVPGLDTVEPHPQLCTFNTNEHCQYSTAETTTFSGSRSTLCRDFGYGARLSCIILGKDPVIRDRLPQLIAEICWIYNGLFNHHRRELTLSLRIVRGRGRASNFPLSSTVTALCWAHPDGGIRVQRGTDTSDLYDLYCCDRTQDGEATDFTHTSRWSLNLLADRFDWGSWSISGPL